MNTGKGFIPDRYSEAFASLDAQHAAREEFWEAFIARNETFTGPIVFPTYPVEGSPS